MFQASNSNFNQEQPTDLVSSLKQWWHTCPLFTRFIFFACIGLGILSHFDNLPTMLVNKPTYVVNDYQVTRLIFSPFVFKSIIQALLAFITYLPVAAQQEKENGTLKSIIDFFLKNIEINLMFVGLCYLMSHFFTKWWLSQEAYGLWSILFLQIVERCLLEPGDTTAFLLPTIRLPNKYYPIVLVVLFSVITGAPRLDMVAAAVAAVINLKFVNAPYDEKFSHQKMAGWESHSALTWLKTLPNFVSVSGSGSGSERLIPEHGREYDHNNFGDRTPSPTSPNPKKKNSGSFYGDGEIKLGEIKAANKRNENVDI